MVGRGVELMYVMYGRTYLVRKKALTYHTYSSPPWSSCTMKGRAVEGTEASMAARRAVTQRAGKTAQKRQSRFWPEVVVSCISG